MRKVQKKYARERPKNTFPRCLQQGRGSAIARGWNWESEQDTERARSGNGTYLYRMPGISSRTARDNNADAPPMRYDTGTRARYPFSYAYEGRALSARRRRVTEPKTGEHYYVLLSVGSESLHRPRGAMDLRKDTRSHPVEDSHSFGKHIREKPNAIFARFLLSL